MQNYIATAKGYIDGRIIQPGEAFAHDFKELVRDEGKPKGPGGVFPIKRDKDGNAVTKKASPPSWAEPADDAAVAAANAVNQPNADVNLSEMSVTELRAYAATLPVDVTALKSKEDILAAIAAWNDPKR